MARFFIPLLGLAAVFSLGSCAIPSNWNELLGSDHVLFPETILSAKNPPVPTSRVLGELSSMLANPEMSSRIYSKYLAAYEKPERRNNINVFKKNLMLIAKRNILFHTGKSSWEEGINKFTDMPSEELRQFFGGLPKGPSPIAAAHSTSNLTIPQAPDSLDWREKGAVGPVKNQGGCGSCWSFSANVAVEGNLAKSTGQAVVPLSEQDLVSCFKQDCDGEFPWVALDWIESNGVASGADYPYTSGNGRAGSCQKVAKTAQVVSYVRSQDESEYRGLTAQHGPFSCALYYHDDMTRQKSGVYDGACGDGSANGKGNEHAIGIVGYGNEGGLNYWIIRNSYGEDFADNGYVKIRADVDKCGLESYLGATFVTEVKNL